MEMLILIGALSLTLLLAVVKSLQYAPSTLSQFELGRRADQGDGTAAYELYRRPLLPTLTGFKLFKEVVIATALALLLLTTHVWWIGVPLLVVLLLAAELAATKGLFVSMAQGFQRALEPKVIHVIAHVSAIFKHFVPQRDASQAFAVGSREELIDIIKQDTQLLSPSEKAHVQAAMATSDLKIKDVMAPRDSIATVAVNETVGPLLLDRLHKVGRQVFVVVKKDDLDDIKGFLHMTDATSGHPGIKTVKDALRPVVHYILQDEPLASVLGASLQSGRQLFIVVDNQGNTRGLISLGDALAKLLGSAPPAHVHLSTDPKKVTEELS